MIKERPICRKVIVKKGFVPFPSVKEWDGLHAKITSDREETVAQQAVSIAMSFFDLADRQVYLSDGLRKQMKKMIAEGFFK